MSTIQTIVTAMRVKLQEATASQWSDANQLIPYASQAERWLARMLSQIPGSRRFNKRETFTLAANTEAFDLTTLSKRFASIMEVAVLVGQVYVPMERFNDEDEEGLRNYSLGGGYLRSKYTLMDDSLVFLPTYQAARTMAIRYRWIPTIKSSSSDTIETPAEYDQDLVNRALHDASGDIGQQNQSFEEKYAIRLAEIEDLERSRMGMRDERVVARTRTFGRVR